MDIKSAEALTGLIGREFPDATNDFLRCQLGQYEKVEVQVSAYRRIKTDVFHLLAWGPSWDEVIEALGREKVKDKTCSSASDA